MVNNIVSSLIHDFLILFGIVNIIGNIPHISVLTSDLSKRDKKSIFFISSLTSFALVLLFALCGNFILINVFDITFASFKVAGGIIVFLVAVRGVVLGPSKAIATFQEEEKSQRFFSIVFPFLVGPGTMVTTILLMQASGKLHTSLVVFFVYITSFVILLTIPIIEKLVGKLIMTMISRILYIFIAAKAVKFIISGLKECFAG